MTIKQRTTLATIIRQHNMGILTDSEAYHAICNLLAGE
jgi:hypothetical protein